MAQYLKKQSDKQSDKELTVAINNNARFVEIDLLQWMHLHRIQRCELLIDYARRPRSSDTTAGNKLINFAPLHAMTVTKVGDMWLHAKRIVDIPNGTLLVLVDWKDDDSAVVRTPEGDLVEISHLNLIENDRAWIDMINEAEQKYSVVYEPFCGRVSENAYHAHELQGSLE